MEPDFVDLVCRNAPSGVGLPSHSLLPVVLLAVGCAGPATSGSPLEEIEPSAGLESVALDGLTLMRPPGARLLEGDTVEGDVVTVLGPMVAVRPPEAEWSWSGAAYSLEIRTHRNPDGLGPEEFARRWMGDTNGLAEAIGPASVGGRSGFQVESFGGDSQWVHIFVADGGRMRVFTYNEAPVANNPIAAVARDAVALLLGTVRWSERTG